eukprot:EG_transcript_5951
MPMQSRRADSGQGSSSPNVTLPIFAGLSAFLFLPTVLVIIGLGPVASAVFLYHKLRSGGLRINRPDFLKEHNIDISFDHSSIAPAAASRHAVLSWALLHQQNDVTSEAVVALLHNNVLFQELSHNEVKLLKVRDAEDAEKLGQGIASSIRKGVVAAVGAVEPVTAISVDGKTALEVADEVLQHVPTVTRGMVFIFQGLSGTGKGTTVATLRKRIPNAVAWSNGNVFRALTFMLVRQCEAEGRPLASELITHERVRELMECLHFGYHRGKYDVTMRWDGTTHLLSEIENTLLKEPCVTHHIPTVAQEVQGEVILFASAALERLCAAGLNVLLEGRAETLQYFRSPFRFELVATNVELLGHRRCAQRIMAQALRRLPQPTATPEQVRNALHAALHDIATPHPAGPAVRRDAATEAEEVRLLRSLGNSADTAFGRVLSAA